jgi:hypothetical protein
MESLLRDTTKLPSALFNLIPISFMLQQQWGSLFTKPEVGEKPRPLEQHPCLDNHLVPFPQLHNNSSLDAE